MAMEKRRLAYFPPVWEELPLQTEDVLCTSPTDGSNEGITIEDWNLN